MSRLRRLASYALLLLVCLSALLGSSLYARAQSEQTEVENPRARVLFEAGRDAYDHGRFTEALALYEQAYALSPRSKMLFNIGRAAEADDNYGRAIEAYEGYLQALPQAENREFVQARVKRLRALAAAPASAGAPPSVTPAPSARPPAREAQAAPPVSRPGASQRAPARATASPSRAATPHPAPEGSAYQPYPLVQEAQSYTSEPTHRTRRFRLYGGLRLGALGTLSLERDDFDATFEADLKPSGGLQVGAGWVWRIFGIGLELRRDWLRVDSAGLDLKLVEILAKPRVGYQLQSWPLEFYGAIPLGVAVPSGQFDTGVSLGFLVGATLFFGDRFGLNLETGVQMRFLGLYEATATLSEWTVLNANFVVAL